MEFSQKYINQTQHLDTELRQLWDPNYKPPYIANKIKIRSNSLNYFKKGLTENVMTHDKEQSGSTSLISTTSIMSLSIQKTLKQTTI